MQKIFEILKALNWIDFLSIFLLLRLVYLGAKTGLTAELFKLIGTIVSITVGFHYYEYIAASMTGYIDVPIWFAQFAVLILIVLAVSIIFKYGVALVLKIMNVQFVSQLERAGGALIGLCRGVLIGGLVLVALSLFPIDYFQSSISEKSLLSPYLIKSTTTTYAFIMRFLPKQESKKSDIKSSAKQVKQSKKAVK